MICTSAKIPSEKEDKGMQSKKIVIIINGNGGAGKDTLCGFAARHFSVQNISSITPIKKIAAENGWDGAKDGKSRKFLADLKQLFTDYNDLPNRYLVGEYHRFLESNHTVLFVHIREGSEIDKFRACVDIPCVTLLVKKDFREDVVWGNASDDDVERYPYDYCYHNEKPFEEAETDFVAFLEKIMAEA